MNGKIYLLNIIIKTYRRLVEYLKDVEYWNARFDHFARFSSRFTGRPLAFNAAILVILTWIITGPLFGFSDTWQLIINTATTIVTFLMVFLIQHTQNRDTEALQVKMDELIRVIEGANNALLDLEELEEQELFELRKQYVDLARLAREKSVKKIT
ncbi:MAG: low affinity iron permease family protein [Methylococcaceae bacterium]